MQDLYSTNLLCFLKKYAYYKRDLYYYLHYYLVLLSYPVDKGILFFCLHCTSSIPPYRIHCPWNINSSLIFKLSHHHVTGQESTSAPCPWTKERTIHWHQQWHHIIMYIYHSQVQQPLKNIKFMISPIQEKKKLPAVDHNRSFGSKLLPVPSDLKDEGYKTRLLIRNTSCGPPSEPHVGHFSDQVVF